jgi:WD40 repeat protein
MNAIAISEDNKWLACSQTDERSHPEITVGIYEITTGKRVGRLSKVDSISVRMLAFMRNDRQLVCCSPGRVEIWDLTTYTLVQKWSFRRRCFRGAIVTPDRILVCGASDGLTMMDLRSGVITACVSGLGLIHRLAYAPATKGIAFTTWSGSVGVWNPSTGCVVHLSPDDTQKFDRWPAVAIAPDGQAVFYGGVDGMVRVWYINN